MTYQLGSHTRLLHKDHAPVEFDTQFPVKKRIALNKRYSNRQSSDAQEIIWMIPSNPSCRRGKSIAICMVMISKK